MKSNTTQTQADEKADVLALASVEWRERPPHPGMTLRALYLKPSRITLTNFAAHIGVSRRTISMIVNGSRPISVDMANRLARALETSAQFWLNLQHDVDIWDALREHGADYARIEPLKTAK